MALSPEKNLISKCIPSLLLTYFWAIYFLPSIWMQSRVQNINLSICFPNLKQFQMYEHFLKKKSFLEHQVSPQIPNWETMT